ncbi:hypothetical protein K7W42_11075 [Deinococcus sp. HMF7604]|uniref:hypothetical protein n=1 Tax=Deinococcus betulae TaxID=2873312 RepID=UPI001CCE2E99|nr:hypothetical protein [Deinococcus betulae]MBZ9751405.1 hypothetical protein [Deinococcus betulae]
MTVQRTLTALLTFALMTAVVAQAAAPAPQTQGTVRGGGGSFGGGGATGSW